MAQLVIALRACSVPMLTESEVGLFLVDSGAGSTRGVKLSTCYAHQLNPETPDLRRHPWPAEEKLTASTQKSPPEPMSSQSHGPDQAVY